MKLHEQIKRAGRPKGEETVTPSLRVGKKEWEQLKAKYPGKVNAMFREFVTTMLQKDIK